MAAIFIAGPGGADLGAQPGPDLLLAYSRVIVDPDDLTQLNGATNVFALFAGAIC